MGFEMMMILSTISMIIGIVLFFYFKEMHTLYSSNKIFINEEKKRRDRNFEKTNDISVRGPSMSGNRYEEDGGKVRIIPEERSALVSYI